MIKKGDRILAQHVNAVIPRRRISPPMCSGDIIGARYIVARYVESNKDKAYLPMAIGRIKNTSSNKPKIDLMTQFFDGNNLYVVQYVSILSGFFIAADFFEIRYYRGTARYIHAGIGIVMITRVSGDDDPLKQRRAYMHKTLGRLYFSAGGDIQVLWVGEKFSWKDGYQYSYAVIRWNGFTNEGS